MKVREHHGERIRTVTWEDPKVSARDSAVISGLDYLTAIKEGRVKPPPMAMLIGYKLVEIEAGRVVFELEPDEYHYNPFASVHGGIAATVLDSAMTSSVFSTLPIGSGCSTIEMKINFVRPMTRRTGILQAEGKVVHVGARIATAEGRLTNREGTLYAHAVTTCMIFRARTKP
jgi:uncharacterized protein (TIGR00369 family)